MSLDHTSALYANGRRVPLVLAIGLALVLAVASTPAADAARGPADNGPGVRLIVTTDAANPPGAAAFLARGVTAFERLDFVPNTNVVVAPPHRVGAIAAMDGVVTVVEDFVVEVQHHACGHDRGPGGAPDCWEVSGTVVGDEGGDGISGASVTLDGPRSYSTTTDGNGAFAFAEVVDGTYTATASADGYVAASQEVIVEGDTTLGITLVSEGENDDEDDGGDDGNGEDDGDDASDQQVPWGVERIGAPEAWPTTTGADTLVCVADTGIDADHEDLDVVDGRNFTRGNPNNWGDRHGHGTHVAGTVAALDNDLGVVGVAPDTGLLAAKVLDNSGGGAWSWVLNGIGWCADRGADVINLSLGGPDPNNDDHDATLADVAKDVVLVAASGNDGDPSPLFPASHADVIAVGATDEGDDIAWFSNREEDLNAPGVEILSTVRGDGYEAWSGTSMATPHVAGTAALLRSCEATGDVRQLLTSTAEDIGDGKRLDAAAAVAEACGS